MLKFFTCLEMPVNITQYRGVFNNCHFVFRRKFRNFIGHKCWSTDHFCFKLYLPIFPMNLVLLLVFVMIDLPPKCSIILVQEIPVYQ